MAVAGDAGQVLWNFTYGDQWSTDQMFDVIECSTGGFLMAGDTYGYGAQGADALIVRSNSSEGTVWYRLLEIPAATTPKKSSNAAMAVSRFFVCARISRWSTTYG